MAQRRHSPSRLLLTQSGHLTRKPGGAMVMGGERSFAYWGSPPNEIVAIRLAKRPATLTDNDDPRYSDRS